MGRFELTRKAERDLQEIFAYTLREHGEEQGHAYVAALYDRFRLLAEQPGLARRADRIKRGYLRFEHAKHVIFLKRSDAGILIVRVLHQRMEPRRHL